MKIDIARFRTKPAPTGFVASFDARTDLGITIRSLTLFRPNAWPKELWLVVPYTEKGRRHSVGLSEDVRKAIGKAAVERFNAETGMHLLYASQQDLAGESYDVGLLRVLGDAERDALDMAGI